MKCDKCGKDKNVWMETQSITNPNRPYGRKQIICHKCLGWLDKHIEEQKENRELMEKITAPYSAAELCEFNNRR